MADIGAKAAAFLPLRVQSIEEGELDQRRKAVLFGPQIAESFFGPLARAEYGDSLACMASRLGAVEKKIDAVLALLLRQEQTHAREEAVALELWGEGMSFSWPTRLSPGQILELNLTLSWLPPIDVHLIAEVIDCLPEIGADDAARNFRITTSFRVVNETQQDAIYRFIIAAEGQRRRQEREEEP